jgi:hypothetical protein
MLKQLRETESTFSCDKQQRLMLNQLPKKKSELVKKKNKKKLSLLTKRQKTRENMKPNSKRKE